MYDPQAGHTRNTQFVRVIKTIFRDLAHAARSLRKTRAFTFVCVVSLGIGMATVVAIPYFFRVLTTPPPAVNTDGLVEILMTPHGPLRVQALDWATEKWSYPDFVDLRDADTGIAMTGWTVGEAAVQPRNEAQRMMLPTMFVSANYFSTVGVSLALGPGFDTAVDDSFTAEPAVILSYDFWQNRLGSQPDIVGKTLTVDGIPHVVVGIAPDQYYAHISDGDLPRAQLFVPLERHRRLRGQKNLRSNRDIDWVQIHGRLSPGVSIGQANAAVSVTMSRLAELHPASNKFKAASVEPYYAAGAGARSDLMIVQSMLLGLSGMILLVVCLNISAMMHVRGAMRERELSIRQAVGATRRRLIQYLLSEAIILAAVGGALGTFVLFDIPMVLAWWYGQPVPLQMQDALKPDLPILGLCLGLCLVTSLAFGLLPALRLSRPAIISALKDDAGVGGRSVGRVQRLAVAVQIGIAVPFLVISGMLLNQVRTTATADLGFEPEKLAAARLNLGAREPEDAAFSLRTARNNLKQASGIDSVTVADSLPLDFQRRITKVSRPVDADGIPDIEEVHVTRVAEGYLNTMGIPLLRGRSITAEDRDGAELVTVISKPLADKLFPNVDAVGEQLIFTLEGNTPQAFRIVGVTGDFVTSQMSTPRSQLLVPLAQHVVSSVFLVVRHTSDQRSTTLTGALENTIRDLQPDDSSPIDVVTGDEIRRRSMLSFMEESAMAALSGGVVLALAALGIYGVVGFMVATRTREIAVRIALGASNQRVLAVILFDVAKLVLPGVAGGLLLAMAMVLGEWGRLTGVQFLAYMFGAVTAMLVALMASLLAARRATSVAPVIAMRSE